MAEKQGKGAAMIAPADKAHKQRAAELLAAGEIVALPTETVYGLAADAGNAAAVAKIFAAKGRPAHNPLIVHVSGAEMAADYAEISPLAAKLMARFWPGALSLVLPLRAGSPLAPAITAGLGAVALRCPQGAFADIIRLLGRPLAAPSANLSGCVSPTSAEAVERGMGGKIPLILDGGPCAVGVESTIVAVRGAELVLLRAGGVARAEIEAAAGCPLRAAGAKEGIAAPGMMRSHYAPRAQVRLNAKTVRKGEALLAFGRKRAKGAEQAVAMRNLSESGDTQEAARNLFRFLAELDMALGERGGGENKAGVIAAEPIAATGAGEAVNDRLRRAAAKRDGKG